LNNNVAKDYVTWQAVYSAAICGHTNCNPKPYFDNHIASFDYFISL